MIFHSFLTHTHTDIFIYISYRLPFISCFFYLLSRLSSVFNVVGREKKKHRYFFHNATVRLHCGSWGEKMENTIKERGKVRYALTFAAR